MLVEIFAQGSTHPLTVNVTPAEHEQILRTGKLGQLALNAITIAFHTEEESGEDHTGKILYSFEAAKRGAPAFRAVDIDDEGEE